MADSITPETVSIRALAEFESADVLEDHLRQLSKLEAGDGFDEQLFDLSGDNAFLAFHNQPNEDDQPDSLILAPADQAPPESEGEEDTLSISANFEYGSIDLFQRAFTEILSSVDTIEVESIAFSFTLERDFDSLDPLRPILNATDHDVIGVRLREVGFEYIFQKDDDQSSVMAVSREEFPATSGEFILEQLDKSSPIIEEITHDTESS